MELTALFLPLSTFLLLCFFDLLHPTGPILKKETPQGGIVMSNNSPKKYDEEFKKSLVTLFQNGKTRTQLSKEYGISQSALAKWIKQYSTVEVDDGQVLTAKQIKELQKRNAQLEEENLILKKAIAILTPHSNSD